ncbi:hypothetical protein G7054_g10988 [Neopestalotiopsis clavispora]|nr:hypothetical protein G7054_g10988 [Neopestalotiopsis clavispora]
MIPSITLFLSGFVTIAAGCSTQLPIVPLEQGAACACMQLAATYGDAVLYQNSSNYMTESINNWDKRCNLEPKCIFMPSEADQVSKALSVLSSCGAQFAIRGGGHMNFPGANNIDGGVLLALNNMTHLEVSGDNTTIEVGPGNRWVDVYTELDKYDRYAIGGRLKTIGVPGLSLIGGWHYLNNKYGWTMDTVVSYDVVLGNGSQVVANADSHPELFWALKGGAANFGVVTKFTFQTFPISQISTTIQSFNESDLPEFVDATCDLVNNDLPDIAAGGVISVSYNQTTDSFTGSLLGVQEGTESPPSRFANYSAIPPISTRNNVVRPVQWHANLETPNQMFRVQDFHHTIKADKAQLRAILAAWQEAVREGVSDVEGLYATFVMNIMPKSANTVAKTNGVGNVWGMDDTESYILWQFSTAWANQADDLRMTNWAHNLVEYWHQDNQAKGLAHDFLYAGDTSEYQDIFASFPLDNVQRLKEIRSSYDPMGVFSRLNWGGYKLSIK